MSANWGGPGHEVREMGETFGSYQPFIYIKKKIHEITPSDL